MPENSTSAQPRDLAQAVKATCLQAAMEAYQRATFDGLCHEGAWECAVDAIRSVDVDAIVQTFSSSGE